MRNPDARTDYRHSQARQPNLEQLMEATSSSRSKEPESGLRSQLEVLPNAVNSNNQGPQAPQERLLLLDTFLDHSPVMGFIKDAEGRFLYYNRPFCERFAVSKEAWIGKSVFDLFPHEFASAYHADDLEVLTTGVAKMIEETSPGPDESILYWRTHKFPIHQASGTCLLGGVLVDVSSEQSTVARLRRVHADLEAANMELEELSRTDGLTGLANRRGFDERLAKELDSSVPCGALLVLDLDHFKSLNDAYGHPYGDEVLMQVAQLLKAGCRGQDCVARIGGEEFAIILSGAGGRMAQEIAERLRQAIEQHCWPKQALTASFGLALLSPLSEGRRILSEADEALYRAKQMGRNRISS